MKNRKNENKKIKQIGVDIECHKIFKITAAQRGITIKTLVEEFSQEFVIDKNPLPASISSSIDFLIKKNQEKVIQQNFVNEEENKKVRF